MKYENLSKGALKCMYVATFIGTLIGMIITFSGYFIGLNNFGDGYKLLLLIVTIIVSLVLIANLIFAPHFRFKRYKYLINEEKIDVIEGFIWKKRIIVPISRIHKITLNRGPIDTMFGLSKVTLTTAGGEAVIRFLKLDQAEFIADKLKDKVNEVVGDDV